MKRLKAAGFSDVQAETVTDALSESRNFDLSQVVTKADLRAGLSETKADILTWMIGTIGVQTVVILGAVIALVRVLP